MLSPLVMCEIHAHGIGVRAPKRVESYTYLTRRGVERIEYALTFSRDKRLCVDDFAQAAFLCEKIATGHPFIDGNKRAAWSVLVVGLRALGWQITLPPTTGLDLVLALVAHELSYTELAQILREACTVC